VLQIPIFISLYYVLRTDVAEGLFGHAGFLFIPDLTERAHGAVLVTLILGYMTLQLAGSAVATRTLEGGHRRIAMLLPVVFVGVASRFPAGLLVYWVTSSFWTLGQHITSWRLAAATPGPTPALAVPAPPPRPATRPHPRSKKKKAGRRRR
jgi:YidC/Oxa1 family membrane protein insertase